VNGVEGEGEAGRNPLLVEAEGLRGEEEESVEEVKTVLDKLLLYLRVVHSIDYYNQVSILSFLCFSSRGFQCCGSGYGFNGVPGSVSGSGFATRIQEGKNYPQT
jgi:hypothetical protein